MRGVERGRGEEVGEEGRVRGEKSEGVRGWLCLATWRWMWVIAVLKQPMYRLLSACPFGLRRRSRSIAGSADLTFDIRNMQVHLYLQTCVCLSPPFWPVQKGAGVGAVQSAGALDHLNAHVLHMYNT